MTAEAGLGFDLGVSALVGLWIWRRLKPSGGRGLWFWVVFLVGYFSSFPLLALKAFVLPWLKATDLLSPELVFFLGGAVFEELMKAFLLLFLLRNFDGLEVWEAAAWGALVSLGFGTAENLIFQIRATDLLWLRFFTALPLHLACGAVLGSGLIQSRRVGGWFFLAAVAEVMAWHGLYNYGVSEGAIPLWFLLGLVMLLLLRVAGLFKRERKTPTGNPGKDGPPPLN